MTQLLHKVTNFNDKSTHFFEFNTFFGLISEGNSRKLFHPFSMSISYNKSMNKSSECDLCRYFRLIFRVGAQNGLGWIWCEDDSKDNDVVYE